MTVEAVEKSSRTSRTTARAVIRLGEGEHRLGEQSGPPNTVAMFVGAPRQARGYF